jgi:hypothetical protein
MPERYTLVRWPQGPSQRLFAHGDVTVEGIEP